MQSTHQRLSTLLSILTLALLTNDVWAQATPRPMTTPRGGATTVTARSMTSAAQTTVTARTTTGPATAQTTPARVTPTPFTAEQVNEHFLPKNAPADLSDVVSVVYSSARRSQLDPCGCVGKQLGGLDKEARLIQWLKDQQLPVVQLDAGGFLKGAGNQVWVLQARLLLRGLGKLKVDAINVGVSDLDAGLKMLQEEQTTASLPFISANIVAEGKPVFAPYKIIETKTKSGKPLRIGVIGVTRGAVQTSLPPRPAATRMTTGPATTVRTTGTATIPVAPNSRTGAWILEELPKGLGAEASPADSNTTNAYEVIDQVEAIRKYLDEVAQNSDVVILLDFEARDFVTRTLTRLGADADKIHIAVAGEYLQPVHNVTLVGKTRLVSAGFEGRYVGHMMFTAADDQITTPANSLIEVVQSIPSVPEFTELMNDARAEVDRFSAEQRRQTGSTGAMGTQGKITFAGHQACQQCHPKEHAQWKATTHAKAMQTLMESGHQNDRNCVRCHVTGFEEDNGFRDMASTPKFADVQCEVCHGPAFQHVVQQRRAQIMKRMAETSPTPVTMPQEEAKLRTKFDEQFCVQCHDANNDPKFDFARDIKFVDHTTNEKRPADAPATRETTGSAARMGRI
jgi:2',3'-cyclic-nucleotide 2'-phosphodiesterase (5'-nucleotidase family)